MCSLLYRLGGYNMLSIIVPIYNAEKYLSQCIESILKQTYTNFELILVNDGSTDNCSAIIKSYKEKDKRIRFLETINQGLVKARLEGVQNAGGDYITFVDADDWISDDTYQKLMELLGENDLIASGIFRYHDETWNDADIPILAEGKYLQGDIEEKIIPYMLWSYKKGIWELDPSLCTKIIKKDLIYKYLLKISDLDIYYGEDSAVIYPLMLEAKSIVITHQCFYYHRQRHKSNIAPYIKEQTFFSKLFSLYSYLKNEFSNSRFKEILQLELEHFYINSVCLKQQCYQEIIEETVNIFPFWMMNKNKKIVLYGAGEVGKSFMEQNEKYRFCQIVLWVDKNYLNIGQQNIVSPAEIKNISYDYILVAVKNAGLAFEVRNHLIQEGLDYTKIMWSGTYSHRFSLPENEKMNRISRIRAKI